MKQYQISMAKKTVLFFSLVLTVLITAAACASIDTRAEKSTGQIFLYGEAHGNPIMKNRQLEIWYEYYHNQNMRHLFIEFPFFTAELLNVWMQSDNDDILNEFYTDRAFASAIFRYYVKFFRTIKNEFPETVFHGVDIGWGYWLEGRRFLQHLRDNNMQGTERYLLTLEAIEQGKRFYRYNDAEFRVTSMAENFIRTFDRLGGQSVMGIFGAAHTRFGFYSIVGRPNSPTLAQRLRERYGDSVHTTDLIWLFLLTDPIKTDIITINGIDYKASYFGTDSAAFRDVVSRSFWRLENAYDDFRDKPTIEDFLPFEDYPMVIELNQVFIVDLALTDGTVLRLFFRSDGEYWHDVPVTTGVIVSGFWHPMLD